MPNVTIAGLPAAATVPDSVLVEIQDETLGASGSLKATLAQVRATTAAQVSFDNSGTGLSAVTAQAAIVEVNAEKAPLSAQTAAGTSVDGSAGLTATNAQDAFEELNTGKAAASHTHSTAAITSGVFPVARLGTGAADENTALFGDGTWKPVTPGGGGGTAATTSFDPIAGIPEDDVQGAITNLQTNKAATTHNHNASAINAGTMATARLGGGTANSSTVLYGDSQWRSISATLNPSGLADSDGFNDTDFEIVGRGTATQRMPYIGKGCLDVLRYRSNTDGRIETGNISDSAQRTRNGNIFQSAVNYASSNGKFFEFPAARINFTKPGNGTSADPGGIYVPGGFTWKGQYESALYQYSNGVPVLTCGSRADAYQVSQYGHIDGVQLEYGSLQTSPNANYMRLGNLCWWTIEHFLIGTSNTISKGWNGITVGSGPQFGGDEGYTYFQCVIRSGRMSAPVNFGIDISANGGGTGNILEDVYIVRSKANGYLSTAATGCNLSTGSTTVTNTNGFANYQAGDFVGAATNGAIAYGTTVVSVGSTSMVLSTAPLQNLTGQTLQRLRNENEDATVTPFRFAGGFWADQTVNRCNAEWMNASGPLFDVARFHGSITECHWEGCSWNGAAIRVGSESNVRIISNGIKEPDMRRYTGKTGPARYVQLTGSYSSVKIENCYYDISGTQYTGSSTSDPVLRYRNTGRQAMIVGSDDLDSNGNRVIIEQFQFRTAGGRAAPCYHADQLISSSNTQIELGLVQKYDHCFSPPRNYFNAGNADFNLYVMDVPETVTFATTLTATRTVTLQPWMSYGGTGNVYIRNESYMAAPNGAQRRIRRTAGGAFDLIIENYLGVELARLSGTGTVDVVTDRSNPHAVVMSDNIDYSGQTMTVGNHDNTDSLNFFRNGDVIWVPEATQTNNRTPRTITGISVSGSTTTLTVSGPAFTTGGEPTGRWLAVATLPVWRVV